MPDTWTQIRNRFERWGWFCVDTTVCHNSVTEYAHDAIWDRCMEAYCKKRKDHALRS